jgi:hypothetical protein
MAVLYNLDLKFVAFLLKLAFQSFFETNGVTEKPRIAIIQNRKLTYLVFKYLVSFYSYVFSKEMKTNQRDAKLIFTKQLTNFLRSIFLR